MIHLYAIARGARVPPDLLGLEDVGPEIVPCGPLDAVVSEHDRSPQPDRAGALRHAEVVAAVAEHAPVVPVRFGVQHADRTSLRQALHAAEDELLRSLERVGGHVEFVVRGSRGAAPPTRTVAPDGDRARIGGTPGRDYLEQRLAGEREARRAAQVATAELRALTGPLNDQAEIVVERIGPHGPERCYLVDRSALASFSATASACLQDHDELVLGGPWPPYTFAMEALGS